jgi:hypothetical protein
MVVKSGEERRKHENPSSPVWQYICRTLKMQDLYVTSSKGEQTYRFKEYTVQLICHQLLTFPWIKWWPLDILMYSICTKDMRTCAIIYFVNRRSCCCPSYTAMSSLANAKPRSWSQRGICLQPLKPQLPDLWKQIVSIFALLKLCMKMFIRQFGILDVAMNPPILSNTSKGAKKQTVWKIIFAS